MTIIEKGGSGYATIESAIQILEEVKELPEEHRERLQKLLSGPDKVAIPEPKDAFVKSLKANFEKHKYSLSKGVGRNLEWEEVEKALVGSPEKLKAIKRLAISGGEPMLIMVEGEDLVFGDGRKGKHGDENCDDYDSAILGASEMGVELMDKAQYKALQKIGSVDSAGTKTLIRTPEEIRIKGNVLLGWDDYEDGPLVLEYGEKHFRGPFLWRGVVRFPMAK